MKSTCTWPGFTGVSGGDRGQRGAALVSALWVSALLVLIAADLAAYVRSESRTVHALLNAAQARYAAEGGIQIALHGLLYGGESPWPADGTARELRIAGLPVAVEVWDEAGRVDLNLVQPELLRALLAVCAAEGADVDALTDAILDWRDADSLTRLHGAEDPQYQAAGLAFGAGDRRFESVEELSTVLGLDRRTYAALEQVVSVHANHAGVNPAFAPRAVLLALANGAAGEVDAYLETRQRQSGDGLTQRRPSFVERQFATSARGQSYRVIARVQVPEGPRVSIQAIVMLARGDLMMPVRVLDWRELAGTAVDVQSSQEDAK